MGFSEEIEIPKGWENFDDKVLEVRIVSEIDMSDSFLIDADFSWLISDFTSEDVSIEILFEDPLSVSSSWEERDFVSIRFLDPEAFRPLNSQA